MQIWDRKQVKRVTKMYLKVVHLNLNRAYWWMFENRAQREIYVKHFRTSLEKITVSN